MIVGMGNDLVDIGRIEKMLDDHEERFIDRCFTPVERNAAEKKREIGMHVNVYAKRFAAKEACAKALGTGFNHGIYLKDIGVENDAEGKPVLVLTGAANEKLFDIIPSGYIPSIHLTLTDEPPMAMAHVIIEALEEK